LIVAVALAQVGEFSFVLIQQATGLKLLPINAGHQLVAASIISIILNPILFANMDRIENLLSKLKWLKVS
jgi:CPA2 family monovalent cation:H+ antiporter-2